MTNVILMVVMCHKIGSVGRSSSIPKVRNHMKVIVCLYVHFPKNFLLNRNIFIKPGARGRRPGFLKSFLFTRWYVCVCLFPRALITSGVIWRYIGHV